MAIRQGTKWFCHDASALVGDQLWVNCRFLRSYPTTVYEWTIQLRSDHQQIVARGETSAMKLAKRAAMQEARKYLAQQKSQPVASSGSA